jgi:glycerol uptake facilitator-like aquaporin
MYEQRQTPAPADAAPLPIGRAAALEAVASFAVVLAAAGSVVVAGSAGSGLVGVAIATGGAFGGALLATLRRSGGGVNPALTAALWIGGRLSARRAGAYVVGQLIGGVVAAFVLRVVVPEPTWRAASLGAPLLALGMGVGSAVLLEAVLAFVLTVLAFLLAADDGTTGSVARLALALGLWTAAATLLAWPLTGAALNPARSLGPELAGGVWADWWVYWIGPGAGAVVGAASSWALLAGPPGETSASGRPEP